MIVLQALQSDFSCLFYSLFLSLRPKNIEYGKGRSYWEDGSKDVG